MTHESKSSEDKRGKNTNPRHIRRFSHVLAFISIVLFITGMFFTGDTLVILWAGSIAFGLFSSWVWDNFIIYDEQGK